jgi:hypothetical protein
VGAHDEPNNTANRCNDGLPCCCTVSKRRYQLPPEERTLLLKMFLTERVTAAALGDLQLLMHYVHMLTRACCPELMSWCPTL